MDNIAAAFGVAPKTIALWQREGFPVAVQGARRTPNQYDLPDCIAWYKDREVAKVQGERPQDRLARAQAIRVEIEIEEAQKRLIPADAVTPLWNAAVVAARELLDRSKRVLARKVAKESDPKVCERLVGQVHTEFLKTMAAWDDAPADDE
jgi:phage terminase Nu1 subunit (DNA packaging protein)